MQRRQQLHRVYVKSNGESRHEVLSGDEPLGWFRTEYEADFVAREYARSRQLNYHGIEYHPTVSFSFADVLAGVASSQASSQASRAA
jgi:hypothetical protein